MVQPLQELVRLGVGVLNFKHMEPDPRLVQIIIAPLTLEQMTIWSIIAVWEKMRENKPHVIDVSHIT